MRFMVLMRTSSGTGSMQLKMHARRVHGHASFNVNYLTYNVFLQQQFIDSRKYVHPILVNDLLVKSILVIAQTDP